MNTTPTPAPMTPEREQQIRARVDAATPGPHFYAYQRGEHLRGVGTLNFGDGDEAEADRDLTVNAREDMRDLLAELDRVRRELGWTTAERDGLLARVTNLEAELDRARGEYLTDNTGTDEDDAYNRGVSDAIAAIGALTEAGGEAS